MRRAFTLIELMVVFSIVAILACLLTACHLGNTKKGKAIACINNLKQIALGDIMYSNDYDDYFLPSNWGKGVFVDSNGATFASDNMYWYCFNYATFEADKVETTLAMAQKKDTALERLQCPALDKPLQMDGDWEKRPNVSYMANGSIHFTTRYCNDTNNGGDGAGDESNGGKWNNWRKTIQAKSPDMLMLYWDRTCAAGVDGSWGLYSFWKTNGGNPETIENTSVRHSKFGNVAFADGHAAATMTLMDWSDLEATRASIANNGVKMGITDKVHATIPIW